MVSYYPKDVSFKDVHRMAPELKLINFDEEQRLSDIAERKARGKGAPKKAKSKGVYIRFSSCVQSYLLSYSIDDSRRLAKKKRKK